MLADDLWAVHFIVAELSAKPALRPLEAITDVINGPHGAGNAFVFFVWVEIVIKFVVVTNIEKFFCFVKTLDMFAFFIYN
jgi:hypothetical protein